MLFDTKVFRRIFTGSAVRDCQRAAIVTGAVALLGAFGACDGNVECRSFGDCPSGERCNSENVCELVPDNPQPTPNPSPQPTPTPSPSPPDGGVDPGDGGPGPEGPVEIQVQTQFTVPYMQPDIERPSTRVLVPHYETGGGAVSVDQMRLLDTTTERIGNQPVYNFIGVVDGPCGIEGIVAEPTLNDGETWVACRDQLRIYYDFQQPAHIPGMLVHHGITVTPKVANDNSRRIWFERGGTELFSFVIRPTQDAPYLERLRDEIQQATFSGIVDVVQLQNANAVPGESLMVVDRSDDDIRLVFLQHDTGTNILRPHTSLSPLSLGDKGHTVVVIGDIDVTGQANPLNVPNIMVFEPENGVARYFKAENGEEVLPPTIFEPGAGYRAPAPDPDVRQIHAMSPSGDAVFYALPGVPKLWRIPIAPGSDNIVTFHIMNNATLEPTGIFPVEEQLAWVSTSQDRLIFRTRFVGVGN